MASQSSDLETIKKQLAKAKLAANQNNVLSLEMKAYEKSLEDTSQKLKNKILEVKQVSLADI